MFKFKNDTKGFSLIELIITVVLVLVLVSVGYLVIDAGNDNFAKGSAKAHMQANARLLDEFIQTNIRNATNIKITSIEDEKLNNRMSLVDNIAVSNGVNITAAVIEDFQIKIDDSGDRPILEYIINTLYKDETFELRSSIVLNNLTADYFGGAYSDFTSIGDASFTYNAEAIIPQGEFLAIDPSFIVRNRNITEESPQSFDIYLFRDTFVEGISYNDISLLGGIAALDIASVERINDTLIRVNFDSGYVTDAVVTGTFFIHASGLSGGADLEVDVSVIDPNIKYIEIEGPTSIEVPETGNTTVEFKVTTIDYEDREISEPVLWSLLETMPGVTLNIDEGKATSLTVAQGTYSGTIILHAQSTSNETVTDNYEVNIIPAQEPLESIMENVFLLYAETYTDTSRPTYLIIGNIDGVELEFVDDVTAENFSVVGVNNEQLEITANAENISQQVKVLASRDGIFYIKEFDIYVPFYDKKKTGPIVITPGDIYQYSPPS